MRNNKVYARLQDINYVKIILDKLMEINEGITVMPSKIQVEEKYWFN